MALGALCDPGVGDAVSVLAERIRTHARRIDQLASAPCPNVAPGDELRERARDLQRIAADLVAISTLMQGAPAC